MLEKKSSLWIIKIRSFFILSFLTTLILGLQPASASVIDAIRVEGTQRIESETVLSYLNLQTGDLFDQKKLNQGMKALFKTGFFKDISFKRDDSTLIVQVVENPVVGKVIFEGAVTFSDEELLQMVRVKSPEIYNRAKTDQDLTAIRQAYRLKGLFLAKVELSTQSLQEKNAVNLTYQITEGEKSKVSAIRFIGNKAISDKDLMDKTVIQPTDWLSWITEKDTYDQDKLLFDQSQIRNFYLDQGYVRVRVDSSVAEITPDREAFVISHAILEGERYKFGEIQIQSNFDELPEDALYEELLIKKGAWYSRRELNKSVENLSERVGDFGYAFLDIRPQKRINDKEKQVDVVIRLAKGRRVYLDRVEISGNTRTEDQVIRREVQLTEGDRFSVSNVRKTKKRLEALNFFETVEITTPPSAKLNDRVNLKVKVKEKPTGAFTVGAGFSTTDQFIGSASVSQNNFLGKGQRLVFSFNLSARTNEFDLNFTEPYFLDKPISAGFDLYNREFERETTSFKQETYGGALRLGFVISEHLRNDASYRISNVKVTNSGDSSSPVLQDQVARSPYVQSMISNTITWNSLNSMILPSDGHRLRLTSDLAGLGGDVQFFRFLSDNSIYHKLSDSMDLVGHLRGRAGVIEGIDDDVPIYERFFLGGTRSIRGFKPSGVGPRTTDGDAYGGRYFGQANMELWFPLMGLGEHGVRALTFVDAGIIGDWETISSSVQQEDSPRVSAGFGLHWNSPFGPLRVALGFPIVKEDYDEVQRFDFSMGTVM
ncbi:outer membrane protein assembly factor BamA [Magnetococcales bacterium HHB-1]